MAVSKGSEPIQSVTSRNFELDVGRIRGLCACACEQSFISDVSVKAVVSCVT